MRIDYYRSDTSLNEDKTITVLGHLCTLPIGIYTPTPFPLYFSFAHYSPDLHSFDSTFSPPPSPVQCNIQNLILCFFFTPCHSRISEYLFCFSLKLPLPPTFPLYTKLKLFSTFFCSALNLEYTIFFH